MIRAVLSLFALLFLVLPASAQYDGYASDIYANDGTYLGNTGSQYDPNSIYNPYGTYGSKYSNQSMNNPYGQYGSQYSINSPNNQYAEPATMVTPLGNKKFGGSPYMRW